jgi:hypothetical protein
MIVCCTTLTAELIFAVSILFFKMVSRAVVSKKFHHTIMFLRKMRKTAVVITQGSYKATLLLKTGPSQIISFLECCREDRSSR